MSREIIGNVNLWYCDDGERSTAADKRKSLRNDL